MFLFGNISYLLPSRQMSFVLHAGSDTLPTPLNLARWKIQSNPCCPICGSRNPTTLNILNGCVSALNQGRDTWRHDSVLSCIVSWLTPTLGEDKCMYADLPGHQASDSPPATIPTDVLSTSCRPFMWKLVKLEDSRQGFCRFNCKTQQTNNHKGHM